MHNFENVLLFMKTYSLLQSTDPLSNNKKVFLRMTQELDARNSMFDPRCRNTRFISTRSWQYNKILHDKGLRSFP